jgi:hypothetical protein
LLKVDLLIIEKSSLTLKNLSLRTLCVSDSQIILEGCSFPQGEDFPSPRLEIVSFEVALEGVRIAGGKVGIHVRDSRLTLREVSLTGLGEVGIRVEGKTGVEGERLSMRQCGRGPEVLRRKGEEGCIFRNDSLKAQTADASEKSAKSPAQTSVGTRHP